MQKSVGVVDSLLGRWIDALERVVDMEQSVFMFSQSMIWKNFDSFDIVKRLDEGIGFFQKFVVIRDGRNKNVPDPYGKVLAVKVTEHLNDVRVFFSCQLLMDFVVDALDVDHEKVADTEKLIEFLQIVLIHGEGGSGSVDGDVDSFFFGKAAEFDEEIHLDQWFSAGNGDSAMVLPIGFEANQFLQRFFWRDGHVFVEYPCIGVMAEKATEWTASKK